MNLTGLEVPLLRQHAADNRDLWRPAFVQRGPLDGFVLDLQHPDKLDKQLYMSILNNAFLTQSGAKKTQRTAEID